MDDTLIKKVHKKVNDEFYSEFPLFDMANLVKHPAGHWTLREIERIIQAYEELRRTNKRT